MVSAVSERSVETASNSHPWTFPAKFASSGSMMREISAVEICVVVVAEESEDADIFAEKKNLKRLKLDVAKEDKQSNDAQLTKIFENPISECNTFIYCVKLEELEHPDPIGFSRLKFNDIRSISICMFVHVQINAMTSDAPTAATAEMVSVGAATDANLHVGAPLMSEYSKP